MPRLLNPHPNPSVLYKVRFVVEKREDGGKKNNGKTKTTSPYTCRACIEQKEITKKAANIKGKWKKGRKQCIHNQKCGKGIADKMGYFLKKKKEKKTCQMSNWQPEKLK